MSAATRQCQREYLECLQKGKQILVKLTKLCSWLHINPSTEHISQKVATATEARHNCPKNSLLRHGMRSEAGNGKFESSIDNG